MNIEWKHVGYELHGFLEGQEHTTLFIIGLDSRGRRTLKGAFIPDETDKTASYPAIHYAKEAAYEHLRRWVGTNQGNMQKLRVGEFEIWKAQKGFWIEHDSGEGGQFDGEKLAEVIREFYQREF